MDCIKHDRINCKMAWSRAQVAYRTETDLSIRFLNEKNRSHDRIVAADSAEIMPFKSRTPNYEQLLNLKYITLFHQYKNRENDLVDACDTASIWINSTVFKVTEVVNEYEERVVEY